MLSCDLAALADRLNDYAETGMELAPEAVISLRDVLAAAAVQARCLEVFGGPVPPPAAPKGGAA